MLIKKRMEDKIHLLISKYDWNGIYQNLNNNYVNYYLYY